MSSSPSGKAERTWERLNTHADDTKLQRADASNRRITVILPLLHGFYSPPPCLKICAMNPSRIPPQTNLHHLDHKSTIITVTARFESLSNGTWELWMFMSSSWRWWRTVLWILGWWQRIVGWGFVLAGTGHRVINDWLSCTYHRRPPQSIK